MLYIDEIVSSVTLTGIKTKFRVTKNVLLGYCYQIIRHKLLRDQIIDKYTKMAVLLDNETKYKLFFLIN